MAEKNDGGDKTEKPTPKKLQDARKKGNISKSKEITSTAELILWFALLGLAFGYAADQISDLMSSTFTDLSGEFIDTAPALGWMALETLLIITAIFLIPIAIFGLLVEFLQTGPVITAEKFKPKLENLNPAEGLKRMFSMDNLVEVIKAIVKTSLLFFIGWLVLKPLLPELAVLPSATPGAVSDAMWLIAFKLLAWTVGIFACISAIDAAYQRYSFIKKMRMSMRDIRQEVKENEGDPLIKSHRRQAHQEWSQQSAANAAGNANVLIVNPTHVAIALNYDRESCPVPTIAAKGEDFIARAMREAAEEARVPIIRNVALARDLLARAEVGEIIPADFFDIIAEVILWAREVRENIEQERDAITSATENGNRRYTPPGEDLTQYPDNVLDH